VSADSTADVSDTEPQHGLVRYHGKSICPETMEFNFADVSSSFGDDVDLELLDDFLEHYGQESLEAGALDDEGEAELSIDDVYQRAHSVKGAATQLNMKDLARTAYCLEVITHAMGSKSPSGTSEVRACLLATRAPTHRRGGAPKFECRWLESYSRPR